MRADLEQVIGDAERLREYAERTRAHRTPERNVNTSDVTFQALHKAIADIRRVIEKYYAVLTLKSIARWDPVPQYDTIGPFMAPWVVDREGVAAAADEDSEE